VLPPGTRIDDRYEVIDALGSGGMGHVYRAKRVRLGDEVAIKVMQATPAASPDLHERFLRESRACAQLRHPNIVGILDFGVDAAQQPYLAMELLSGPSLREEIELEAPMAPSRVAAILGAVASALDLAHGRGITHRDLKPANIVVHQYEPGERVYKVIDFGLASIKAGNDDTRLTNPNFFLGTLAYAAPEQMSGGEIAPATDIYALGVIAYEMLTGARPFDGASRATLVDQVATTKPASLATRRGSLPGALDTAVMKAMAKEPSQRYSKAADFVSALEAAGGEASAPTGPASQETGLLSRYELGGLLGRGRLGSLIYRGTHRALGVPVAIRIIKRDDQPNWEAVRARFLLEARTLQVAHPGLLQARDFEEDERHLYLVTDFIEGPSLRQAFADAGPFPWPRAKVLLAQALDAVAALHRSGGFIAGVNPDMIRLRASIPGATADKSAARGGKPSAFAQSATADRLGLPEQIIMSCAGIRSVQDVLATMKEQELRGQEASEHELPYVAPEILMGGPPSVQADVFTIGVLAYQMVTGRPAFRAPSLRS
jgi:serine/threonine protein kinase